jgi:hypothetical protein
MTRAHVITDDGAQTGAAPRWRRRHPVYQRVPGCAVCGLGAATCARFPTCDGPKAWRSLGSTKRARRRWWGGLEARAR